MKNKLNSKQRRFQTNRKAFILITVLCMGIGFALLSSNLTITGNTSVSGNSWNVYFTNVQVTDGSVDATVVPTTTGTNTTSIDYTVTLDKPGDFYEFTVDAVNNGTIDAMIQSINMTSLDTDVAKYLSYTATYSYGATLELNDVLENNTTATYRVRVEYNTDISAEDLNEEEINLNLTFGVNYTQSKINNKVTEFTKLLKNNALWDRNIDFTNISSATNGRGLYVLDSTKTDEYPIYYYRGAVENNNAMFAGLCWKIVRTTETGGTKLLYNGLPRNVYPTKLKLDSNEYKNLENSGTYPYVYNSNSKEWTSNPTEAINQMEISFSVEEAGDYFFNYNLVSESHGLEVRLYKDEQVVDYLHESSGSIEFYGLTTESEIKIVYRLYSWAENTGNDSFSFNIEKGVNGVIGCNNIGNLTQLPTTTKFNPERNSPAYSGYMYGTLYEWKENYGRTGSNYVYGNTFTYENGTYTLSDTHDGVDANHHYTCFSSGTTCESINYVYFVEDRNSKAFYITLTGGKDIDTAWREMQTNTTSSTVKTVVDNWFNNTFRTYFTTNEADYNDYLEDTIWCNDRSINTIDVALPSGWSQNSTIDHGFDPNGGSIYNSLWYSSYGRVKSGIPSLTCSNKNDSFTVTESETGNGALTYPVGLLTADEMVLAGGQLRPDEEIYEEYVIPDFYLNTNQEWWGMSPGIFYSGSVSLASEFYVDYNGDVSHWNTNETHGVRPSISLKPGVKVRDDGDGTAASPYEFIVE